MQYIGNINHILGCVIEYIEKNKNKIENPIELNHHYLNVFEAAFDDVIYNRLCDWRTSLLVNKNLDEESILNLGKNIGNYVFNL